MIKINKIGVKKSKIKQKKKRNINSDKIKR